MHNTIKAMRNSPFANKPIITDIPTRINVNTTTNVILLINPTAYARITSPSLARNVTLRQAYTITHEKENRTKQLKQY